MASKANMIPKTHRLSDLETKLLEALQCYTRFFEPLAVQAQYLAESARRIEKKRSKP